MMAVDAGMWRVSYALICSIQNEKSGAEGNNPLPQAEEIEC
jgi:hypothetical protein